MKNNKINREVCLNKIFSTVLVVISLGGIAEAGEVVNFDKNLNITIYGNGTGMDHDGYPPVGQDGVSSGLVEGFTLNLLPGSKVLNAIGGQAWNNNAINNRVNLNNSNVVSVDGFDGHVSGGEIFSNLYNEADNNKIIVNGGVYQGGMGAFIQGCGSAKNNTAILNYGKINTLAGANVCADKENHENNNNEIVVKAINNIVIVNDGETEYVVGGASYNSPYYDGVMHAFSIGNHVIINGGIINGNVYGGDVLLNKNINSTCEVRDNVVTWNDGIINGVICGDCCFDERSKKNIWNENSNSTFNFYASSSNSNKTITGIGNFKNYNFYLDDTVQPNTTLINVKNSVDLSKSNIGVAMTSNAKLSKGDSVNLLSSSEGIKTATNLVNDVSHMENNSARVYGENVYDVYDFGLQNDGFNLKATVGNVSPNTKNEIIPESRQPEVAFLDDKLDVVDTAYNMSVGKSEPVIYFDFNYTDVKKDNVTMRGSENVLGSALTKGDEEKKNTITQGPFLEYGDGSFGGKNFYSTGDVDASGKTEKYGTGYLFRQVRAGRHHYDAYFRLGKIKNDFRSHMYGVGNVNYDNSDMYYAAHLGYGQYIPIDHHTKMDVYGKYFYKLIPGTSTTTHVNSDTDINTDFDKLDSHKFRIGSKITWDYMQEKKKMMFADVALEHELSHTQRTTLGDRVTSNSSGADTTGVIEIGYRQVFGPKDAFLFTADLQGYVGTRSGLGGNIGVRFNF